MTTLELGGAARLFAHATSVSALVDAFTWARAEGHAVLVLGGGSNIVVSDRGFDGLVLRVGVGASTIAWDEGSGELVAGAGANWDGVVRFAVENDLAGLECLSGIPGTAGATPIQNVGAYGQDVGATLTRVEAVDRATGEVVAIDRKACDFRYRDSAFKRGLRDRFAITEVRFALRRGEAPRVAYPELEKHLAPKRSPSIADVREAVLALRRSKSMVIEPNDENRRSVGSFFTNPIVPKALADEARARWQARADGTSMPAFPRDDGVKLSAAWLIERSGFAKEHVERNGRHFVAAFPRAREPWRCDSDGSRCVRRRGAASRTRNVRYRARAGTRAHRLRARRDARALRLKLRDSPSQCDRMPRRGGVIALRVRARRGPRSCFHARRTFAEGAHNGGRHLSPRRTSTYRRLASTFPNGGACARTAHLVTKPSKHQRARIVRFDAARFARVAGAVFFAGGEAFARGRSPFPSSSARESFFGAIKR